MRTGFIGVLALALSSAVGVSANAATVHHQRARPHVTVDPSRVLPRQPVRLASQFPVGVTKPRGDGWITPVRCGKAPDGGR